jgi:hypothetical protein
MKSTSTIPFPAAACCGSTEAFEPEVHESTYGLLVRSEEKSRSIFEIIVYVLCILSAVTSIWQFARQSTTLPPSVSRTPVSHASASGCEVAVVRI